MFAPLRTTNFGPSRVVRLPFDRGPLTNSPTPPPCWGSNGSPEQSFSPFLNYADSNPRMKDLGFGLEYPINRVGALLVHTCTRLAAESHEMTHGTKSLQNAGRTIPKGLLVPRELHTVLCVCGNRGNPVHMEGGGECLIGLRHSPQGVPQSSPYP